MASPRNSLWHQELNPLDWFDETIEAEGWFDREFLTGGPDFATASSQAQSTAAVASVGADTAVATSNAATTQNGKDQVFQGQPHRQVSPTSEMASEAVFFGVPLVQTAPEYNVALVSNSVDVSVTTRSAGKTQATTAVSLATTATSSQAQSAAAAADVDWRWHFIQSVQLYSAGPWGDPPSPITLSGFDLTAGHHVVVAITSMSTATAVHAVTDTAGNTYLPLTQTRNASAAGSVKPQAQLYYCLNATGQTGNVVTVRVSSGGDFGATWDTVVVVAEFDSPPGYGAAFDLEGSKTTGGTAAATITSNAFSTAGAGLVFVAQDNGAPGSSFDSYATTTFTPGYTKLALASGMSSTNTFTQAAYRATAAALSGHTITYGTGASNDRILAYASFVSTLLVSIATSQAQTAAAMGGVSSDATAATSSAATTAAAASASSTSADSTVTTSQAQSAAAVATVSVDASATTSQAQSASASAEASNGSQVTTSQAQTVNAQGELSITGTASTAQAQTAAAAAGVESSASTSTSQAQSTSATGTVAASADVATSQAQSASSTLAAAYVGEVATSQAQSSSAQASVASAVTVATSQGQSSAAEVGIAVTVTATTSQAQSTAAQLRRELPGGLDTAQAQTVQAQASVGDSVSVQTRQGQSLAVMAAVAIDTIAATAQAQQLNASASPGIVGVVSTGQSAQTISATLLEFIPQVGSLRATPRLRPAVGGRANTEPALLHTQMQVRSAVRGGGVSAAVALLEGQILTRPAVRGHTDTRPQP